MRLDKFLVESGLGSRSQVKQLLKKGQVWVNGTAVTSAKTQIDERSDQIVVDGQTLVYEKFVYYLLNKPKGVISATEDARQKEVFPVGRLDVDTHGLLLLTNNGQLSHAMLSPKRHVAKVYQAQVAGLMDQADVERFAQGIELKDFTCQPAQLEIIERNEGAQTSLVRITLSEGKFHQVKRMVLACGKEVTDLQRLSMGPLQLDPSLELGQWRRLTEEEMQSLEIFQVEL